MAEMTEKDRREHLLQGSGSQGVGGCCWYIPRSRIDASADVPTKADKL